jgi:hypothetical protein
MERYVKNDKIHVQQIQECVFSENKQKAVGPSWSQRFCKIIQITKMCFPTHVLPLSTIATSDSEKIRHAVD